MRAERFSSIFYIFFQLDSTVFFIFIFFYFCSNVECSTRSRALTLYTMKFGTTHESNVFLGYCIFENAGFLLYFSIHIIHQIRIYTAKMSHPIITVLFRTIFFSLWMIMNSFLCLPIIITNYIYKIVSGVALKIRFHWYPIHTTKNWNIHQGKHVL